MSVDVTNCFVIHLTVAKDGKVLDKSGILVISVKLYITKKITIC